MKIKKSKKGGLQFFLLIITVIVFILTFLYYRATSPKPQIDFVGQSGFLVLKASQNGFNALSYIHLSADISLQNALYVLASTGGKIKSSCGRLSGVNNWAEIKKQGEAITVEECYPSEDELKHALAFYFNKELNEYLAIYPDAFIPGDYDYEITKEEGGFEISAAAKNNEMIEVAIVQGTNPSVENAIYGQQGHSAESGEINLDDVEPEVLSKYEELVREAEKDGISITAGACRAKNPIGCVTSGFRGSKGQHGKGLALDIRARNLGDQLKLAKIADKVGFKGIGLSPCIPPHLHIDMRKEKFIFVEINGKAVRASDNLKSMEKFANEVKCSG